MKKHLIACLTALFFLNVTLLAGEGMWIPLLLEKFNIQEMQAMGCKLSAEDIYSINKASMKDAVVIFGGGCTGELISGEGLLLTNYHCGYSLIQRHSSLENDYLTDGFWAMNPGEELPNPGLSVTFLVRMEDITEKVLEGIEDDMPFGDREELIRERSLELMREAVDGSHYSVHVEPFYQGNQYFMFIEEEYQDVRLVGAPPSAIGKFGGDTDNWEWPRHTGDFSLFRIYAGKDNLPADYSPENVPYVPKKFFPISLKGVQTGDFTMVFGYPGSTSRYVPSFHIQMLTEELYPKLIEVRDRKLQIMNADMETSPLIRLQYSAKSNSLSNSWKRWIGETQGLKKLDVIGQKKTFERDFMLWVQSDPVRTKKYGHILNKYESLYREYAGYRLLAEYYNEVFFRQGAELISYAGTFRVLTDYYKADSSAAAYQRPVENLLRRMDGFFGNYNAPTDEKLFSALMELFDRYVDPEMQPDVFVRMKQKYGEDYQAWSHEVFEKSLFDEKASMESFLKGFKPGSVKKIVKDPAFELFTGAYALYLSRIVPEYNRLLMEISELDRLYMKAQMEFQEGERLFPDANFTLRVSYGQVQGFKARDAVKYEPFTTLQGVMEKDNPDIYDYRVPETLKELYAGKEYGRYAENGELHVCFLASNHTTGGNSGSPVVNAEGQLIGINFDRVWEGVMSDMLFNPDQSRNISLDIRYVLFLIDEYAGAGYLLDEMEIIE